MWQGAFLGGVVGWAFFREWEWPQTVFIVLHCLVLLMKQHSYAFYTGWLSNQYLRRNRLQKELASLPDTPSENLTRTESATEDRERLVQDIEQADRDLTGKVVGKNMYPNNITFANFLDYMLCPTLVYELEYPRTDKYPHIPILHSFFPPSPSISAWVLIVESEYRIFWKRQQRH